MCRTLRFIVVIALMSLAVGHAGAQESTNENDLRDVISSLQRGSPDYSDMEIALRVAVREQKNQVQRFLRQLGKVREITFEGTEDGIDNYFVEHDGGRSIWKFARAPSGRIAVLWFNAI